MEELTLKQKAEAYNRALERANESFKALCEMLVHIFPELKENEESEDEKIRKELIAYFKNLSDVYSLEPLEINPKKAIAWLENQGEQKSADKVEPKFKEGDFVVFVATENVYKVEKIENYEYTLRRIFGGSLCLPFSNEVLIRKWNIHDAENGDILTTKDGETFIFKDCSDFHHPDAPVAYCGINDENNFHISKSNNWWAASDEVYPATKEQRETLMKAMADAGYTFDFEKKELKEIEKKPTEWSEEDEDMYLSALEYILRYPASRNSVANWFKSLKQRYIWKPTKEQIEALDEVYKTHGANSSCRRILLKLLNDLKKLSK